MHVKMEYIEYSNQNGAWKPSTHDKRGRRKIFDNYHKAFQSWTSINARFPLQWPSPDKTAYQTTRHGFFSSPKLDYENNGHIREIPLDLELRQSPARLASPRWKWRDKLCRLRIFGPLFSLDWHRSDVGHSQGDLSVTPRPTQTWTSVEQVLRWSRPACLLTSNPLSLTFGSVRGPPFSGAACKNSPRTTCYTCIVRNIL